MHDREIKFELAKKIVVEKKLKYYSHIWAYIGISVSTFYDYFPLDSKKSKELKELVQSNVIFETEKTFNRWEKSENSTLEIARLKSFCSEDILQRLNGDIELVKIKRAELQLQLDRFEFEKSKLKESEMPPLPTIGFPDELES